MNFEFLNNVKIEGNKKQREKFKMAHSDCVISENYVKINPTAAIFFMRRALEGFYKYFYEYCDNKPVNGTLKALIDAVKKDYIDENCPAHMVRKGSNAIVHLDEKMGNTNVATDKNIKHAINILKQLHSELCERFSVTDCIFDEDKLPFDGYDIIRLVRKNEAECIAEGDVVVDSFNYFVKQEVCNYFYYSYIQCVSVGSESTDLNYRLQETIQKMKREKARNSALIIPSVIGTFAEGSDRVLLSYDVADKDCYLLCEQGERTGKLEKKQILKIALNIVEDLIELKEMGIHHRNINPHSILLDPRLNGDLDAHLINMQTSKIDSYDKTVIGNVTKTWKNSFIPSILQELSDITTFNNWEKVDVYSVCKIIFYCFDTNDKNTNDVKYVDCDNYDDAEILLCDEEFSLDFCRVFESLFEIDIDFTDIPNLSKFKEILEKEIKGLIE